MKQAMVNTTKPEEQVPDYEFGVVMFVRAAIAQARAQEHARCVELLRAQYGSIFADWLEQHGPRKGALTDGAHGVAGSRTC